MKKIITDYSFISTKNGDKGTTRNYSNDTLQKTDVLFETLGSIDELNSLLGVTFHYVEQKPLIQSIQLDLQHIMSQIATRLDDPRYIKLTLITDEAIKQLESAEQDVLSECKIEPRFVLPGSESSIGGAYFDMSRAIARRCERQVLRFKEANQRDDLVLVATYLNRLSDLLFILARSNDNKNND